MEANVHFCPCGSQVAYEECCQQFHVGSKSPITALELMRSRYSAFAKGQIEYIMNTHYEKTRPLDQKNEIEMWANSVHWIKLEILQFTEGTQNDITGTVEFKAHFKEKGIKRFLHERSFFKKEFGHWYYVDKF